MRVVPRPRLQPVRVSLFLGPSMQIMRTLGSKVSQQDLVWAICRPTVIFVMRTPTSCLFLQPCGAHYAYMSSRNPIKNVSKGQRDGGSGAHGVIGTIRLDWWLLHMDLRPLGEGAHPAGTQTLHSNSRNYGSAVYVGSRRICIINITGPRKTTSTQGSSKTVFLVSP